MKIILKQWSIADVRNNQLLYGLYIINIKNITSFNAYSIIIYNSWKWFK